MNQWQQYLLVVLSIFLIFSASGIGQVVEAWTISPPAMSARVDNDGNLFGFNSQSMGAENTDIRIWKIDSDGDYVFDVFWNNASVDAGNRIYNDLQGNIYVAGASYNPIPRSPFVLKYDPDGTLLWQKLYDLPSQFWQSSLEKSAANSDGDILVFGYGYDTTDCGSYCYSLYGLGVYDQNYNTPWEFTRDQCSVTKNDPSIVALASSEEAYVGFRTWEMDICLDGNCEEIDGCSNQFNGQLLKINPNGSTDWTLDVVSFTRYLIVDNNDNLIRYAGDINTDLNLNYLEKYNPGGTRLWQKTLNYGLGGFKFNSDNDLIVVGTWNSPGSKDGNEINNNLYYVAKFDGDNGNKVWEHSINLQPSLGLGVDDKIYVAGEVPDTHPNDECRLYCYSSDGTLLSNDLLGINHTDRIIGIDDNNGIYMTNINDQYIAKFLTSKSLEFYDAAGELIANTELEFIKIMGNSPDFEADTLGIITTDADGRFELPIHTVDSFIVNHNGGSSKIAVSDNIKISKHVYSESAQRHKAVLGTMYSIYLDNARITEAGDIIFDLLGNDAVQEIYLGHSEFRYNLLVSIEWDATTEYITGLRENLKRSANYLYDLSDGQIRFDTVIIYDKSDFWSEADIQIYSNNYQWPMAGVYGIRNAASSSIMYPRKWYGDTLSGRNNSVSDSYPLDINTPRDLRTLVHEFGHYGLGFFDEYMFTGTGIRCVAMSKPPYFGFMDFQYESGEPFASEMSNQYQYQIAECRNTEQYDYCGFRSCWDFLEFELEGEYGLDNIFVPMLKPDKTDSDENIISGDWFPGPNEYGQLLTYDVGSLIIFGGTTVGQAIGVSNRLAIITFSGPSGVGIKGADVTLRRSYQDGSGGFDLISQGKTSDLGLIYVLGVANLHDRLTASVGRVHNVPTKSSNFLSGNRIWYTGSIDMTNMEGDSITLELTEIDGDFPMIGDLALNADQATFTADFAYLFATEPSLDLYTEDSTSGYSFVTADSSYQSILTDSLTKRGTIIFNAVDGSSDTFFINFDYRVTLFSDSTVPMQFYGPDSRALMQFDSTDGVIEKAAIMSTGYPVIRTGISADALQIGETQMISYFPDHALIEGNNLYIRYFDDELLQSNWLGEESDLSMYYWNRSSREWEAVLSSVDTDANIVSSEISQSGTFALFAISSWVDIEDDYGLVLPYKFELSQNYPNPFNPVTTISYTIPTRSDVAIEVFNIMGQKVRTLINETKSAGEYTIEWNGDNSNGSQVATGIYLYKFQAGDYIETKKMVLLK